MPLFLAQEMSHKVSVASDLKRIRCLDFGFLVGVRGVRVRGVRGASGAAATIFISHVLSCLAMHLFGLPALTSSLVYFFLLVFCLHFVLVIIFKKKSCHPGGGCSALL